MESMARSKTRLQSAQKCKRTRAATAQKKSRGTVEAASRGVLVKQRSAIEGNEFFGSRSKQKRASAAKNAHALNDSIAFQRLFYVQCMVALIFLFKENFFSRVFIKFYRKSDVIRIEFLVNKIWISFETSTIWFLLIHPYSHAKHKCTHTAWRLMQVAVWFSTKEILKCTSNAMGVQMRRCLDCDNDRCVPRQLLQRLRVSNGDGCEH